MEKKLCTAAIQFNVALGEIDRSLAKVAEALKRVAKQGVQLAVLPEMDDYRSQIRCYHDRRPEIYGTLS